MAAARVGVEVSQPLFGPNSVAVEIGTSCGSQPGSREGLSRRVHRGRRRRRATRSPDLPRDFGATPRQLRAPASSRGRLRTERLGHRSFPRDFGRELSSGEAAARHAEELDAAKTAVAKKPTICLAFVRQAWAKRRRSCRSDYSFGERGRNARLFSSGRVLSQKPSLGQAATLPRAVAKGQAAARTRQASARTRGGQVAFSQKALLARLLLSHERLPKLRLPRLASAGQSRGCCSGTRWASAGQRSGCCSRRRPASQAWAAPTRRPNVDERPGYRSDSSAESGRQIRLLLGLVWLARLKEARLPLRLVCRKQEKGQAAASGARLESAGQRSTAARARLASTAERRPLGVVWSAQVRGQAAAWGLVWRAWAKGQAATRTRLATARRAEATASFCGPRSPDESEHSRSSGFGHRPPEESPSLGETPTLASGGQKKSPGFCSGSSGDRGSSGKRGRERTPRLPLRRVCQKWATNARLLLLRFVQIRQRRLWRHLALHAHAPWSLLSPESFAERAFSRRRRRGF